jgi:hypothetical protein
VNNKARRRAELRSSDNTRKAQSAAEYLMTYSWALLLIALVVAAVYFFATTSQTTVSTSCTFSNGPYCSDMVLGSNSVQSSFAIYLTNAQPYAVAYPQLKLNLSNMPPATGTCVPNLVLEGGTMICNLTLPKKPIATGTLVSGTIYVSTVPCTGANLTNCQGGQRQTYSGTFTTHVSPLLSSIPINISIKAQSTAPAANGGRDAITATVNMLGTPLAGASVNFAQNVTFSTLAPLEAASGTDGNATTYISSTTKGLVNVNAIFANSIANVIINFSAPASVTVQLGSDISGAVCTQQDSGTSVVSVDGQSYPCSQLPLNFGFSATSTHTYACLTPISTGAGSQTLFSSVSGCGVPNSQSGSFTTGAPGSSCAISCEYTLQYYIIESANPSSGGSVSPGSGWVNAGSGVLISESPNTGYTFLNWAGSGTGSYSGTLTSTSVTLNNPMTEQANFQTTTSTTSSSSSTSTTKTTTSSTTSTTSTTTTLISCDNYYNGCYSSLTACRNVFGSKATCPIGAQGCVSPNCCCEGGLVT